MAMDQVNALCEQLVKAVTVMMDPSSTQRYRLEALKVAGVLVPRARPPFALESISARPRLCRARASPASPRRHPRSAPALRPRRCQAPRPLLASLTPPRDPFDALCTAFHPCAQPHVPPGHPSSRADPAPKARTVLQGPLCCEDKGTLLTLPTLRPAPSPITLS